MRSPNLSLCSAVLAALVAGCGGGIVIADFDDPWDDNPLRRSGRPASMTVSAAASSRLDGVYATDDALVTSVVRFGAQDGEAETCRLLFDGLRKQGVPGLVMGGEIRYAPATFAVRTSFIVIDGFEFRAGGSAGATVDRTNQRVVFAAVVFRSTQGSADTITVDGNIPLRSESRPPGC